MTEPDYGEALFEAVRARSMEIAAHLDDELRVLVRDNEKIVVVHPSQTVEPVWLAGRRVHRSAYVPVGQAIVIDPSLLPDGWDL